MNEKLNAGNLESALEKLELPPNIVITSGSAIKIDALNKMLGMLFPHAVFNVTGVQVESGVGEQPVDEKTLEGALTRARNARALQDEREKQTSAVISIENGIFKNGEEWEDKAVVVLILPDKEPISFTSRGVSFPQEAVTEAQRRDGGFTKHTVGSVIAEDPKKYIGKDITVNKQDPHSALTDGQFTREQQLLEAIKGVFEEAAK